MGPERFAPLAPDDAALLYRELSALDPDRALSLAFVPDAQRGAALALSRFFAEVELVPARVSEPMIGAIRVQWWREALGEVYTGGLCRAHPMVRALGATADGGDRPALDAALDAVPAFLEHATLADTEAMVAAFEPFAGACADVLTRRLGAPSGSARRLCAVAALARTLCRPPAPAQGTSIETPAQRAARSAATDLGAHRERLLAMHEAARADVPRDGTAAILPAALTRSYLRGTEPGPLRKRLALTTAAARGRV